jgi:hypothetical protein
MGFGHLDNSRSCEIHPGGCGDALVLCKEDFGVGMLLCIHNIIVPNELAVHVIKKDGTNGCCVGFAKHEYATEENVQKYDGYCAFGQCLHQVPRQPIILPPPCPQELCLHRCRDYQWGDVVLADAMNFYVINTIILILDPS